jgi:two-component system sensor histidine kinase DesK
VAAAIARQALAQVRSVTGREASGTAAAPGPPAVPDLRAVPDRGADPIGAPLAPRIARFVLIVMVCGHSVQNLMNMLVAAKGLPASVAAAATVAAMAGLQLRHSRPGARPRAWPWTLAVQAVLNYALYPVFGIWALGMSGLVAGSVLLLLPRRLAWASFAAVVAVAGLAVAVDYDLSMSAYSMAFAALSGLAVYGLSRLADLAVELADANRALAKAAVVRERLRVARDVHDLLGLGLSTVALKSDLVARLIDRDDDRASGELDELLRICARARADIRAVTDDDPRLSLHAEIEYAREILVSSGVEVRTDLADPRVPAGTDAILATVLREAITNVLRHSRARACVVETAVREDQVVLRVANDGLADPPVPSGNGATEACARDPDTSGGRGLANLAARAEAAGGTFAAEVADGWYVVTAAVPVPVPATAPA